MKLYGALEAGGTKMVCAIGDEKGNILERVSIPTLTPAETMPAMIDFFNGDMSRYEETATLADDALEDYAKWYKRERRG